MRIDTRLVRLGGVALAVAVATATAPAIAAHAGTTPSPTPSGTVSPSPSSPATTAARATATATATSIATAPAVGATPSAGPTTGTRAATSPSPAATAGSPAPARASLAAAPASSAQAAAWLLTQLTDGDHLTDTYAGTVYADYGGTADVAIALASAGTQDATLIRVVKYLEANVDAYADPKGTEGGPYSGSLGKLALIAEITGQDPHDFGGYDLLGLLTSHVCTAAIAGDYSPCTATGDFANAYSSVSQALDVLALERGGVTVPPTALARLLSLQCADGGFSATLLTGTDSCTADADTTGYAEQALVLDPAAAANVLTASQYLLGSQLADGGWYGASSASATDANANSTALALGALLAAPPAAAPRVAGRSAAREPRLVSQSAVSNGQALLGSLQLADGGLRVSLATTPAAADVLATDQAVPSIAGKTLTTLVHAVTLRTASPTPSTSATATASSPTVEPTTPVATIARGSNDPTAGGTLPFTGTDASLWAELAALLFVLGGGLLVGGHRLRRRGAHR